MRKNKMVFWGLIFTVIFLFGCIKKQSKDITDAKTEIAIGSIPSDLVIPLKDLQVFEDTNYTEVTIVSRNAWDKKRLPAKVLELENSGYTCTPLPLEFEESGETPGMYVQRAVRKVEWTCELIENKINH